ncbi:MAG: DUF4928 family protein [Caldilineaceae bacterium]|nr:DUF4928 family protein [Caldilineaceae bacterium]
MTEIFSFSKVTENWWNDISVRARNKGTVAGGLVLIENLRKELDFRIESHKATGSDQLRNAGARNVQEILSRYGEERVLSKEGGRTNRGLMKNLEPLLKLLSETGIEKLSLKERDKALESMQKFLAARAKDILNSGKISFEYTAGMTSREVVGNILGSARRRQKAGEVAEHLVGAKLALRFPEEKIRNSATSAADMQSKENGDFEMNDCVFHVSVAPNRGHYKKCLDNLANGLRVFFLVPDMKLAGTRQIAESELNGRVSVESIESFVAQNIEELSDFSSKKVAENMRRLLEEYNERLVEVETDLSLQIKIPVAMEK